MDLSSIQKKMNERTYRAKNLGTTKGLSSIIPRNLDKQQTQSFKNDNLEDKKVSDQKVGDQKVSDQKVSDQKVGDQKVSDQRVRLVERNLFNKLLEVHGFRVLNKLTNQETLLLEEIIKRTSVDNEWITLTRVELEAAGIFSNKLASIRNKLAGLKDERFKYQLIEFETYRNEKNKEQTRYRVIV